MKLVVNLVLLVFQVIAVTHSSSLEDVLNEASRKLGFVGRRIYTAQGGLIEEVCLIR